MEKTETLPEEVLAGTKPMPRLITVDGLGRKVPQQEAPKRPAPQTGFRGLIANASSSAVLSDGITPAWGTGNIATQHVAEVRPFIPKDFLTPEERETLVSLQAKCEAFREQIAECHEHPGKFDILRHAYTESPSKANFKKLILEGECRNSLRSRLAEVESLVHHTAEKFSIEQVQPYCLPILSRAADLLIAKGETLLAAERANAEHLGIPLKPSYSLECYGAGVAGIIARANPAGGPSGFIGPRDILDCICDI